MMITTISRYDRAVQEVTTRPNATYVNTHRCYQVLARRAATRKTFLVTYFVVQCRDGDNDTILATFAEPNDAMAEYHRLTEAAA